MIRRRSMNLPTTQAWALFLLALLLPMGLYFGFHAISVPAQTTADQTRTSIPSQTYVSIHNMDPEPDTSQSLLSLSLTSWLLHRITESWFRSVLFTLAFLLIMLIVVATSIAILPRN